MGGRTNERAQAGKAFGKRLALLTVGDFSFPFTAH
jgi:hypothetical protein